jgi:hypothetical protein
MALNGLPVLVAKLFLRELPENIPLSAENHAEPARAFVRTAKVYRAQLFRRRVTFLKSGVPPLEPRLLEPNGTHFCVLFTSNAGKGI